MVLFGLLNYEDYILQTLINSNYTRNALVVLLIYILTAIIRFHISIIICFCISGTWFTDLIFPIIVNVMLSLCSDTLYQYIGTHRPWFEIIADYLITNYSRENFIKWKRIFLIIMCCYIFLVISIMNIDNYFIFLSTAQTAIGFGMCDMIEHRESIYNKVYNWWYQPKVSQIMEEFSLIDNYTEPVKEIVDEPVKELVEEQIKEPVNETIEEKQLTPKIQTPNVSPTFGRKIPKTPTPPSWSPPLIRRISENRHIRRNFGYLQKNTRGNYI